MKLLLRRALLFACICSLLAVLAPAAYRALRVPAVTAGEQAGSVEPSAVRRESPRVGEVLTYDVKMGVIKLGTSVFRQLPGEEVNGTWLQVMSFETDLSRFKDTEMIYSDPVTFLPVIVERDIVNFFFKENITETYDQQKYTLTINKHAGAKEEEILIEKEGPIQHPILLTHYVRDLPGLELGRELGVSLPKKSFQITITSIEEIKVPAGEFRAYRFESSPKQIVIWVSADKRRLPLKIKGLGAVNYVMLLREFEGGTL